jgi:hypothetical protein
MLTKIPTGYSNPTPRPDLRSIKNKPHGKSAKQCKDKQPCCDYSGSEVKAHPFTGADEADNWESIHARSSGWGWMFA